MESGVQLLSIVKVLVADFVDSVMGDAFSVEVVTAPGDGRVDDGHVFLVMVLGTDHLVAQATERSLVSRRSV